MPDCGTRIVARLTRVPRAEDRVRTCRNSPASVRNSIASVRNSIARLRNSQARIERSRSARLHRAFADAFEQRREIDAGGLGGLGEQAGRGHAGK